MLDLCWFNKLPPPSPAQARTHVKQATPNAGPQPHRGAVQRHAYHKRTTLPGVGCRPWFGIHARSALGGFDGRFSIETEIIVAIPPTLTRDIIRQRGWLFPLPPVMLDRVKALRR
jgi:hypothetical protein